MSIVSKLNAVAILLLTNLTLSVAEKKPAALSTIVHAYGIGIPSPEKSLHDLRREAVSDALKNAVRQSCASFSMNLQIEEMQITRREMQLKSSGRAHLVSVINSGWSTTSSLSYYKVQIEAVVLKDLLTENPDNQLYNKQPALVNLSVISSDQNPITEQTERLLTEAFDKLNLEDEQSMLSTPQIMVICTIQNLGTKGTQLKWDISKSVLDQGKQHYAISHTRGSQSIPLNDHSFKEIERLTAVIASEAENMM